MTIHGNMLRAAALLYLAPALAGAQTFEGVVTASLGPKGAKTETVQMKGGRWRMDTQFGGGPATMIADGEGGVIMVVPARKMYTRPPMLQGHARDVGDYGFASTGKMDRVLDHDCEYYKVKAADSPIDGSEWCVTTALGFAAFDPTKQLGSNGSVLKKSFSKGFFVLKGLDAKGAVNYEVVKIEQKSVDDSVFAPPSDYKEMKVPAGVQRP